MAPKIEYKASVAKDLRRLDRAGTTPVLSRIEKALKSETPRAGMLSGEFAGLYKLRVGDFRVIYARTDTGYLVLRVSHWREAYR